MKRLSINDLPPDLRRQVEEQIRKQHPEPQPEPAPKRKRSPTPRLNKTETRFLQDWPPGPAGLILPQALTLDFGDGTSYRPDFVQIRTKQTAQTCTDRQVTAYEIKGGHLGKAAWSRHGLERYRRARDRFSTWIRFELWKWENGAWERLD